MPSGMKGLVRSATTPRNIFAIFLAATCLMLVSWQLDGVDFSDVEASAASLGAGQWLMACLATALSFVFVGQYDALFHRWLQTGVSQARATLSGASAIALAQTLGLGLATGTLARWRSLPDLSLSQALKVTNYVSFSFMAALGLIIAATLMMAPVAGQSGTVMFAGVAVVFTLVAAALSLAQPDWMPVALPPFRLMLRLVALAALDVGFAALALWVLLPGAGEIVTYPIFFASFAVALGAGLLSGAPGGVGPFELCLITLMPSLPEPDLIAAIIGYRLVYYALPACFAILVLARPASAADDKQGEVLPFVSFPRAEAKGLAVLPGHQIVPAGHGLLHVAEASQHLVAIGDPACGGAFGAGELTALHGRAGSRDLWPVLYKVGPESVVEARKFGWQVLRISEEAWIDPVSFNCDGPARRQLRRKLKQANAAGIVVAEAGAVLPIGEMAEVAADWAARSGGERGFSMGRFDADYVAGQRCFLAWSGDRLVGFATFHATAEEWVLDLMRSASDMPDGTMHGLIAQAIRAAGSEGVARFSLAAMLRSDVPDWMRRLPGFRAASGLRRFKESFGPQMTPLYMAAPNSVLLALAAVDILLRIRNPGDLRAPTAAKSSQCAMHFPQTGFLKTEVVCAPFAPHVCVNRKHSRVEISR